MPLISPLSYIPFLFPHSFLLTYPNSYVPLKRGEMEVVDESFKKPGAIPFKWEVRPGVPKLKQCRHHHHQPQETEPYDQFRSSYSLPSTPHKLTPPPSSGSCLTPPPDRLRSSSIRSLSSLRSDRYQYDPPLVTRPQLVSTGCFLAPWLRWKWGKKRSISKSKSKSKSESEPNYTSEFETVARWSVSTRKSLSPWSDSPSSSSFSSHRSSPRPVGDADQWAGFGLF